MGSGRKGFTPAHSQGGLQYQIGESGGRSFSNKPFKRMGPSDGGGEGRFWLSALKANGKSLPEQLSLPTNRASSRKKMIGSKSRCKKGESAALGCLKGKDKLVVEDGLGGGGVAGGAASMWMGGGGDRVRGIRLELYWGWGGVDGPKIQTGICEPIDLILGQEVARKKSVLGLRLFISTHGS